MIEIYKVIRTTDNQELDRGLKQDCVEYINCYLDGWGYKNLIVVLG